LSDSDEELILTPTTIIRNSSSTTSDKQSVNPVMLFRIDECESGLKVNVKTVVADINTNDLQFIAEFTNEYSKSLKHASNLNDIYSISSA